MCAAGFQTHCLQDMCNTVADSRCRCQRKVYDTKRNAQHLRCFCANQLTHSSDLECGFLDDVCNLIDRRIRILGYGRTYNTRAGNAYVDNAVWFADTVECTSHKRIVFRCIAENNQFRRTNTLTVCCQLCGFQYNVTHDADSVHIDAASGRTNIDRRAKPGGDIQSLRDGADQFQITGAESLVYQCRVTADKVDTAGFSCSLQRFCEFDRTVFRAGSSQHCNRCNGNSFVDNRNAVFFFNFFAGLYQFFCLSGDFIIDLVTRFVDVRVNTVQQRNTHGCGTNVQTFILDHSNCFQDISCVKHSTIHNSSPAFQLLDTIIRYDALR